MMLYQALRIHRTIWFLTTTGRSKTNVPQLCQLSSYLCIGHPAIKPLASPIPSIPIHSVRLPVIVRMIRSYSKSAFKPLAHKATLNAVTNYQAQLGCALALPPTVDTRGPTEFPASTVSLQPPHRNSVLRGITECARYLVRLVGRPVSLESASRELFECVDWVLWEQRTWLEEFSVEFFF